MNAQRTDILDNLTVISSCVSFYASGVHTYVKLIYNQISI